MPTPNRKVWNINAVGAHEGQQPVMQELLGCSIVLDHDTNVWEFLGPMPAHKVEAIVPPDADGHAAKAPFNFPRFRSALNGDIEKDWYIQLSTREAARQERVLGYWSNSHYPRVGEFVDGSVPPADPDTFTAQAGVGEGEGEAAAAAGSSNQ